MTISKVITRMKRLWCWGAQRYLIASGSIRTVHEETNRGQAAPGPNDASCVAVPSLSALRRAADKTVRRSRSFVRLAARQIVTSARCFMNSHIPRKLVQGAEPFIGSIDAVTRYLSIPPQSQSEWLLISQLKLISVPG